MSQPARYGEKACPRFCVPGASDPLCKGCATKKAKVGEVKKYSTAVWQGYQGDAIPNWSHIAGSKWNIDTRAKHQLAQLKAAAAASGGGAAVKAVVKKAAAVVTASEKTKAAAVGAIHRAEAREERALTAATANIIASVRRKLHLPTPTPALPPRLPPIPAERLFVAPPRASTAAASMSRSRPRPVPRAASHRSSERRPRVSRNLTRRSSGSVRVLPGTNRTASPSLISSPNRNDRLNRSFHSSELERVAPNRLMEPRDPITGRALEPERIALPPPRVKVNAMD